MSPAAPLPAAPAPGPMETSLRARRDGGRKLLVPYLTGGLGPWTEHLRAMADAGADVIEVGIPFSDPAMDGPVIQQASERALQQGTTPGSVLADLRGVDAGVPLVTMTYYNLVFHMGDERMAGELADAGVSGVVLPDVPMEEQGPWRAAAEGAGIETVLMVGPITPDDRLARVCEQSRGYIYGVNLMGITGERKSLGEEGAVLARRVKSLTDKPVLMGFGVSTPEQAVEVSASSDGAIVGTAVVRRILAGESPEQLHAFIASLRKALDES
ncbi:MAG TPA: tryptophan synthase subunit alpha [Acidimicrobiales bacterium]|nr:tryptophan synthase subunit alpha [Acidimicrobiales bacterium]